MSPRQLDISMASIGWLLEDEYQAITNHVFGSLRVPVLIFPRFGIVIVCRCHLSDALGAPCEIP